MDKPEKYLTFEEARKIIISLKFRSRKEFRKYISDNNIKNIPINPSYTYKESWISVSDWLGNPKKSNKNYKKLSYDDSIKIVHNLIKSEKLNSKSDWISFYEKNIKLLKFIPKHPQIAYKNIGWCSWSHWLNTKSKSDVYNYTIDELKSIIIKNNIQTRSDYLKIAKSEILPTNPISKFNLNKWSDILCKKTKRRNKNYLTYNEAKKILKEFNLKSQSDWYSLSKSKKIPNNIPRTPNSYYDDWISWNDWLGHNTTTHKKFLSYKKAKEFLFDKGLSSLQEYYDYVVSNQIDFLPLSPSTYYKSEYKSINDFFSNHNINISYGEKKIINFLEKNKIKYEHQYKFDECVYKNKLIFDFFLPDDNICIEFDGRQHFEPIEFFGGLESFESTKIRDNIKNEFCIENGIFMCRISYEDINIISKILNKLLKL